MELNEIKIRIRKTVPVSSKKDPFCLNNIYLSSNKSVTFGRQLTEGVHVRLLSKTTPLMISRKHATIAPSPESSEEKVCFAVTDHNSINGVYVNNNRITASEPHGLEIGDAITFGCGVGSQSSEFEYIFEAVSTKTNKRVDHLMNHHQNISPTKKKRVTDSPSVTIIESKSIQITEQEAKISRLSEELLIKENIQNELQNKLQETETGLIEKLEKQKADLEVARENAELELKQMLENQLKEKETKLKSEFEEQLKCLENEKICVESKLKEELSHKLSEKDQLYHEELRSQKLSLEQAMIDKENELIAQLKAQEGVIEQYKSVEENQKELENCLLELRKEIQDKESQLKDQKEVTKKVESEAKQNVIQTMEDEFTCIICQELFIEATTLPCAHTFCELCLKLWMRKKKNCPVCRRHIKGKAVRSVVLDSAVEKMIEAMEEGAILRRRELKSERLIQKRKEEASEDPTNVRSLIHHPEEADDDVEFYATNQRHQPRDNRRRRSRSRSPRQLQNHRHRPYEVHNRYQEQVASTSNNYQNDLRNFIPNQVQTFNQRGYYQGGGNDRHYHQQQQIQQPYYQPATNHYHTRCFNCGGNDHIARFCHRR